MITHNNLFEKIASFQNLLLASKLAQRGKRLKNATAFFNMRLERELWRLRDDLLIGRYEPGPYREFMIYEPKERIISAAPYRDRVVHHAVHNVLEPIFDPTFIKDSYATRKGKGTHAAIDRFQKFSRQCTYALKCDIRKYFPSIDREILFRLIKRKVTCPGTLWLIQKILGLHGQILNPGVLRGGSWNNNNPQNLRAAYRNNNNPDNRNNNIGFRVAVAASSQQSQVSRLGLPRWNIIPESRTLMRSGACLMGVQIGFPGLPLVSVRPLLADVTDTYAQLRRTEDAR